MDVDAEVRRYRMMSPGAVDGMESAERRRRAPSDARVHQEHYARGEDGGSGACGVA